MIIHESCSACANGKEKVTTANRQPDKGMLQAKCDYSNLFIRLLIFIVAAFVKQRQFLPESVLN